MWCGAARCGVLCYQVGSRCGRFGCCLSDEVCITFTAGDGSTNGKRYSTVHYRIDELGGGGSGAEQGRAKEEERDGEGYEDEDEVLLQHCRDRDCDDEIIVIVIVIVVAVSTVWPMTGHATSRARRVDGLSSNTF